ncbi:MAG: oligopeptide transporter, OPT family [Alphaproteobacteria bacterium]|nr:oligopeptide transporter, OPT family [Alphaproteobacteria bacterium]
MSENKQGGRVLEFTLRGVILGVLITLIFTAANVYLGLKVGLTFATSIPAAVISMAVLSAFKNSTILENNIVQTVASAAGTLAAIIFVLPALVIVGWWRGFPFIQSFLVCAAGGVLGVLFTIPLRRAMVTTSDLPYPEGVAAAEVLQVGDQARGEATREAREGLRAVVYGAVASAGLAVIAATRVASSTIEKFFAVSGNVGSGFSMSFSLALAGAGYLVGISVGLAMLLGLVISFFGALPILTSVMTPDPGVSAAAFAEDVWVHQVRFLGAGAIGVAAIWTLIKLGGPVVSGILSTVTASRASKNGEANRRDLDMSPGSIILITMICLAISGYVLYEFLSSTPLDADGVTLVVTALPFVFFGGFLIAAVCGYMAGLIGASNSPISGIGILAIVICALLMAVVAQPQTAEAKSALIAYALFSTAIVFAIACISNNNLQDLKTGQLVGATPRAQQWALIVGVVAGAVVIPPILNLLAHAFGFAGAPNIDTVTSQPLPAPQATLIAALAQGVIGNDLNWTMIGVGAAVGAGLILLDELMRLLKWVRLPPLAVGIGIYLPMFATLPVVVGAVIGFVYDRWTKKTPNPEYSKRLATLVASGMIVGESLFGVLLAGLIVATSSEAPLGLVPANFPYQWQIGAALFFGFIGLCYAWAMGRAKKAPANAPLG